MRISAAIILGTGLLAGSGNAPAAVYDIDTVHSEVGFKIRHIVSKTSGRFGEFSGVITYDEKKPKSLKAEITIKTASVDTKDKKRDTHLRGEDFFDAKKFPEMIFVSKKARVSKDGSIKLTGDLTLLGTTKPITLNVEVGGVAKDPWGNVRVGFTATGTLSRKDFGMGYNIPLDTGGVVIGDEVTIILEIEGVARK